MDPARPATLRIPRLPGGMSLASLLGVAEGLYVVNAVVSTLPRSKPAYGFWRYAHETVRVVTQARDLQP
jgi:predicted acetyltransferase